MIKKENFQDYYFISSIPSKKRRKMILELAGTKDPYMIVRLTELVVWESKRILSKKGKDFEVQEGKADRRKFRIGSCYRNAVEMMWNGFGYVEGFVIEKETGQYIGHAWNVDINNKHWDFTYKDPQNYEYFGIHVPKEVVCNVGAKNGHIWFAVLPFVDNDFNYKKT